MEQWEAGGGHSTDPAAALGSALQPAGPVKGARSPIHTKSPALSEEGVFRDPRAASSCSVQHRQPVLTANSLR